MRQEDLKRVLKEVQAYKRSMDGIYVTPLETCEFTAMVNCEYQQLKLVKMHGSYNDKISGYFSMFEIDQNDIDELVRIMGDAPNIEMYCTHDWKLYEGVIHKDWYCSKCNVTREWTWTEK
jgi:hypothetical protein